jgi:uncharacterized membrane protein YesL
MWSFGSRRHDSRDIDKVTAPKRGAALFFDIVAREWWELAKLNLLMVLFSLPVVTIPAMLAGATRITTAMVADENHYLWRDFWESFRGQFFRATILGWLFCVAVAVGVGATLTYAHAMAAAPLHAVPMLVSVFGTVLVVLVWANSVTLMILTEAGMAHILRSAIHLAIVGFLPGLAAMAICVAIWVLHVVAYPVSVFIPATAGFSLCALLMTFQAQRTLAHYAKTIPADPKSCEDEYRLTGCG